MKESIEDGRQQRSNGRRHKFPFIVLGGFKELAYVHIDHETCVVIGPYAQNTYSVLKLSFMVHELQFFILQLVLNLGEIEVLF